MVNFEASDITFGASPVRRQSRRSSATQRRNAGDVGPRRTGIVVRDHATLTHWQSGDDLGVALKTEIELPHFGQEWSNSPRVALSLFVLTGDNARRGQLNHS
jgi:hypothetical protein